MNIYATLLIRRNIFLHWMVRRDTHGVDFGVWEKIDPAVLYIPLDPVKYDFALFGPGVNEKF